MFYHTIPSRSKKDARSIPGAGSISRACRFEFAFVHYFLAYTGVPKSGTVTFSGYPCGVQVRFRGTKMGYSIRFWGTVMGYRYNFEVP